MTDAETLPTYEVDLLDTELLVLDGHCRPEVQALVEAAKRRQEAVARIVRLSPARSALIADIAEYARVHGSIRHIREDIRYCPVCKRSEGYYQYGRTTRYHRKGDVDHNSPRRFTGWDFSDNFVRVQGHVSLGCCDQCYDAIKQALVAELADVQAQVPESITGHPPKWLKAFHQTCGNCGWTGHEYELELLPRMIGSGYYHGRCPRPNCGAEKGLFDRAIKTEKTFSVVERMEGYRYK